MRIFLICLSLIYVLGVSFTQRFSLGGQSCDLAASGFSLNSSQGGVYTQHDRSVDLATGNVQQQFAATNDPSGRGKFAELGHVGVTRANIDPCMD